MWVSVVLGRINIRVFFCCGAAGGHRPLLPLGHLHLHLGLRHAEAPRSGMAPRRGPRPVRVRGLLAPEPWQPAQPGTGAVCWFEVFFSVVAGWWFQRLWFSTFTWED